MCQNEMRQRGPRALDEIKTGQRGIAALISWEDKKMKRLLGLAALLAISSFPAMAQGLSEGVTPTVEVGGGYAFYMWNPPAVDGGRLNLNGWSSNASYNLNKYIGAGFDVTGTRNNQGANGTQDIYSFMAGPILYPMGHHKLTPFVHVVAGLGRYTLYLPAETIEGSTYAASNYAENRIAYGFGGGIDFAVSDRVAIRVGQVDYERTVFSLGGTFPAQNNFKFSAGVQFHFGEK
jgi:opacity protein-like surface antigen